MLVSRKNKLRPPFVIAKKQIKLENILKVDITVLEQLTSECP